MILLSVSFPRFLAFVSHLPDFHELSQLHSSISTRSRTRSCRCDRIYSARVCSPALSTPSSAILLLTVSGLTRRSHLVLNLRALSSSSSSDSASSRRHLLRPCSSIGPSGSTVEDLLRSGCESRETKASSTRLSFGD